MLLFIQAFLFQKKSMSIVIPLTGFRFDKNISYRVFTDWEQSLT